MKYNPSPCPARLPHKCFMLMTYCKKCLLRESCEAMKYPVKGE